MKIKPHKEEPKDQGLEMPELTDQQLRSMRRGTPERTEFFRQALENTFKRPFPPRMGRPTKYPEGKLRPIYILLHPSILSWARNEARKRHVGYQSYLNEVLLTHARAA